MAKIVSVLKQPSAWVPIAMSLVALAFLLSYVALFGIVQHEDEGTPAHLFQLIMIGQLPIMAYFAIRWLPKRPMPALFVLALQAAAWVIPIVTVIWFEAA